MTRRAGTIRLLAVASALSLTACLSGCLGGGEKPDEVDAARLAALQDAPPFDASIYGARWKEMPARAAPSSTNVLAYRGSITSTFAIDQGSPAVDLDPAWQNTFPLAVTLLAGLRDAGWTPVAVSCTAPDNPGAVGSLGTVEIYATGEVDDVVAAASVLFRADGQVIATATMPFHTEVPDPWDATPIAGDTCLDADAPPAASESIGDAPDMIDVPKP